MRTVVGYDAEGHKLWSDNVESTASIKGIRGGLVVGGPSAFEAARIVARRFKAKALLVWEDVPMGAPRKSRDVKMIGRGFPGYVTEEERLAARRKSWRESKARKRAA